MRKPKPCRCSYDEALMRVLKDPKTIVNQVFPGGILTSAKGKLLKNEGTTIIYELEVSDDVSE